MKLYCIVFKCFKNCIFPSVNGHQDKWGTMDRMLMAMFFSLWFVVHGLQLTLCYRPIYFTTTEKEYYFTTGCFRASFPISCKYEAVSRNFRTGRLEQVSATRCSCIAILSLSLVSFASINLCVASQRVFVFVSVYFVIAPVRKLLDTPSYYQCTLGCSLLVRITNKIAFIYRDSRDEDGQLCPCQRYSARNKFAI